MTRTYCDEAGDYALPNVLSPSDLVFRPDIADINCTTTRVFDKPACTTIESSSCLDILGRLSYHLSRVVRKPAFCYAKTNTQIGFAVTFVFAT